MYILICCQFNLYTVNLSTSECIQAKINKGLCAEKQTMCLISDSFYAAVTICMIQNNGTWVPPLHIIKNNVQQKEKVLLQPDVIFPQDL